MDKNSGLLKENYKSIYVSSLVFRMQALLSEVMHYFTITCFSDIYNMIKIHFC